MCASVLVTIKYRSLFVFSLNRETTHFMAHSVAEQIRICYSRSVLRASTHRHTHIRWGTSVSVSPVCLYIGLQNPFLINKYCVSKGKFPNKNIRIQLIYSCKNHSHQNILTKLQISYFSFFVFQILLSCRELMYFN